MFRLRAKEQLICFFGGDPDVGFSASGTINVF